LARAGLRIASQFKITKEREDLRSVSALLLVFFLLFAEYSLGQVATLLLLFTEEVWEKWPPFFSSYLRAMFLSSEQAAAQPGYPFRIILPL
jgi:hypothetical protein